MPRYATSTDLNFEPPRIDPEFLDYLPILSEKDDNELLVELLQDGCRDRILVWDEPNVVVDGHRRVRLCQQHNVSYRVEYRSFKDRAAVKEWMRRNQLFGRRNLTDAQRSYLIGKEYEAADQGGKADVAAKNKVSARKAQLDDKFAKAVDAHELVSPGAKAKILAGGASKTRVLATAPKICRRCVRIGRPVADCGQCAAINMKVPKRAKAPAAPKDLFDVAPPKDEPAPVDPFEELKARTTQLAAAFTRFLTAEGEVAARLCEYLGWCGLLDYGPKGDAPKFIPLAGVRMLVELAGAKGPRKGREAVLDAYKTACGAVPFVPPATKYRRERGRGAK